MWRTSGAMLYLYLLCLAVLMAASGYHRTILNFRAPTSYKKVARLYMRGDSDYTAVMIVPTGVGAKIGGYAGDALPSAKLLSTVVDQLITHPNVMNGAMMYWPKDNIMYVEGFALDQFAEGKLHLQPIGKRSNKIGLLLDKGIEEDIQIRHLHVANAARATLGIDVASCVITSRPVGVSLKVSDSGASWGVVEDTATLVEAAETLVKQGCDAIAVVVRFPEDEEIDSGVQQDSADSTVQVTIDRAGANPLTVAKGASSVNFAINMPHRKYLEEIQDQIDSSNLRTNFNVDGRSVTTEQDQTAERVQKSSPKTAKQLFEDYRNGCGVDAIAGVEAIISHVITKRLGIPCAHAPAFSSMDADLSVSPKACAEELGYTFLPCVLANLHRAPRLVFDTQLSNSLVSAEDVDAVVVPYNSLGGPAVLSFLSKGKLVVAVEDNMTTMEVSKNNLPQVSSGKIVIARSYMEAAGILAADKAGILAESLTTSVPFVPITRLAKFDAISFNREQFSKAVQRVLTSLRAWEWEKVLKWSFHFPSLTEYLAATIKI